MSYRIAGIDVHEKMLAVVASDVEVDGEYRFERRRFGSNPEQLRSVGRMAARTRGRGSGDGIDGAILETGVGSAGAVLETDAPEAGRRRRSQTAVRRGARRISPMPNVW
jgi:hypothetical protein